MKTPWLIKSIQLITVKKKIKSLMPLISSTYNVMKLFLEMETKSKDFATVSNVRDTLNFLYEKLGKNCIEFIFLYDSDDVKNFAYGEPNNITFLDHSAHIVTSDIQTLQQLNYPPEGAKILNRVLGITENGNYLKLAAHTGIINFYTRIINDLEQIVK